MHVRALLRPASTLVGVLLMLFPLLCMAQPQPPGQHFSGGYVAQERCTSCHSNQAVAWAGSHHAWSLREARDGNVLGNFNNARFKEESGVSVRFFKRNGQFFVNTEGEDGLPADFPIAYTFGFDPLQQYLIERPGGRLQSLTVAWDNRPREKGGQRWFSLYPGQRFTPDDALHWTGRYQNWNAMCADCHSGNLRKGYDPISDSFQTTWSEMAVGCQSCHGPGKRHIDWAERHSDASAQTLAAKEMGLEVDFRTRGNGYEVGQCARCHSRRQPLGKGSQPGEPLLDAMRPAVLSPGLYHADGQILDEVFEYGSFAQSKMFAKGVTCSNCHDPHSTQLRAEGNDLCKTCHNPAGNPLFPSLLKKDYDTSRHHHHTQGSLGTQCVNCHMPTRTYMGVDGRHDHSLRIPRPDLDAITGSADACTHCHQDKGAAWATEAMDAWFEHPKREPHYGETIAAARRRDLSIVPQLAALVSDVTRPAIVRASAVELSTAYGTVLQDSVLKALADESPEVRLQAARSLEGLSPSQRLKYLLPLLWDPYLAVRDQAARGLADWRNAGLDAASNERLETLLTDHEQRLKDNADLPATRVNLGILQERLNRPSEAILNYRQALEQDSRYVLARTSLARLMMRQGQVEQAERVLREGLALQPHGQDLGELAYALGLVLAQQERKEDAVALLRRAAKAQPEAIRSYYNLGLLLSRMGRAEEARLAYLDGLARDEGNADLLYALAYLSAQLGQRRAALSYCDKSLSYAQDSRCLRLSQAIRAKMANPE